MTLQVEPLRRMRGYIEPNGSFAVEGSLGSFFEIPFVEDVGARMVLNRPMQSPMHAQQHLDGISEYVHLPRSAQVDFTVNLQTVTTKATNGVTVAQSWLGSLLEIALGGKQLGTGTTVNDASPGASINTLTTVTNIAEGGAIGMPTGTGGALEIREVEDKTGSDITTKHNFTAPPSNGGTVYGVATYFMGGTTGAQTLSLQLAVEGLYTGDRYLLKGGQIGSPPRFELAPGGIPRISWSWVFADWDPADGSATTMNLQTGDLGTSTYTDVVTLVHADSEFRQQTVGTVTIGSPILASDIQIVPNMAYAAQKASAGTNNIVQWIRKRNAPTVSGNFLLPYEDQTWFTARDNKTMKDFMLQIGTTTASGGILITVPSAQVIDVQREDAGGIVGQRVSFVGGLDTDAGSATDLGKSCFRIHMV